MDDACEDPRDELHRQSLVPWGSKTQDVLDTCNAGGRGIHFNDDYFIHVAVPSMKIIVALWTQAAEADACCRR